MSGIDIVELMKALTARQSPPTSVHGLMPSFPPTPAVKGVQDYLGASAKGAFVDPLSDMRSRGQELAGRASGGIQPIVEALRNAYNSPFIQGVEMSPEERAERESAGRPQPLSYNMLEAEQRLKDIGSTIAGVPSSVGGMLEYLQTPSDPYQSQPAVPQSADEPKIIWDPANAPSAATTGAPSSTKTGKWINDLAEGAGPATPPATDETPPKDLNWLQRNQDNIISGLSGAARGAAGPLPVGGGSTGLLFARMAAGMNQQLTEDRDTEEQNARYLEALGLKREGLDIDRQRADATTRAADAAMLRAEALNAAGVTGDDKRKVIQSPRVVTAPNASMRNKVAAMAAERVMEGVDPAFTLRIKKRVSDNLLAVDALTFGGGEEGLEMARMAMVNDKDRNDTIEKAIVQYIRGILTAPFKSLTPEEQEEYIALATLGGAQIE
jgi:hypothetical protein